jgi:hypothetical protein
MSANLPRSSASQAISLPGSAVRTAAQTTAWALSRRSWRIHNAITRPFAIVHPARRHSGAASIRRFFSANVILSARRRRKYKTEFMPI